MRERNITGFDPAYGKDKSVLTELGNNEDGTVTVISQHVNHFVGIGYVLDDEETRARKMAYALCQIYDNAPAGQRRLYLKKRGRGWEGPVFVRTDLTELTA